MKYTINGTSYYLDTDEKTIHKRDKTTVGTYELEENKSKAEVSYGIVLADEYDNDKTSEIAESLVKELALERRDELKESLEAQEIADAARRASAPKMTAAMEKEIQETPVEKLTLVQLAHKAGVPVPVTDMRLGDKTPKVIAFYREHYPELYRKRYGVIGDINEDGKDIVQRKMKGAIQVDEDEASFRTFN